MENPVWNLADLRPPPTVECRYVLSQDKLPLGLIMEAHSALVEAHAVLSEQKLLTSEVFLLERSLYRANNALGRNKFMQQLRMVYKCVQRYIDMKLDVSIGELQSCWKLTCSDPESEIQHLASRQLLQYILVRIMGAAQLLSLTMSHCVQSYILCDQQLKQQLHFPSQIVFLSIVSRIWVLCRALVKQMCNWYSKLYSVHPHLKGTQVEWLPDGIKLPNDLQTWLSPEPGNINLCCESFSSTCTPLVKKFKVQKDDVDKGNKNVMNLSPGQPSMMDGEKECPSEVHEDLGLPIKRRESEHKLPAQCQKENKKKTEATSENRTQRDQFLGCGKSDLQYWTKQVQACTSFKHILDCVQSFRDSAGCKRTWFEKRKEKLKMKQKRFRSLKGRPKAQRKILEKAKTLTIMFIVNYLQKNRQVITKDELDCQLKKCGETNADDRESESFSASKKVKRKKRKKDVSNMCTSQQTKQNSTCDENKNQTISHQVHKNRIKKSCIQIKSQKVLPETGHSQRRTVINSTDDNTLFQLTGKKLKKGMKRKRKDISHSDLGTKLSKKVKRSKHKQQTR